MTGCLSLFCFLAFGPPGVALSGETPAISRAPATSIQAFGRGNACAQWTDSCTTCSAAPRGGPALCSTPGIACTPEPIRCSVAPQP